MDSNGVGEKAAVIRREIAALQKAKADIDDRISALQVQLSTFSRPEPPSGGQLSADMIYRYSRQLILPSFGVEAQGNLLKSSVLVIGAGGLGSPALLYLAACGVGRLGIVDHDVVELNNLHRQIIHTEAYIGRSKVESAAAACRAINSTVLIVEHREAFRTSNALEIMREYDIVVDATDNVPSRYMINDCCVVLGKPLISGAALGLEGQLTVYNYNGGPCYRCLFPIPPPTTACADSGVLGVVPGVIGCLQALEAIKVAGAVGDPLSGRVLLFDDALSARLRVVKIRGRSSQCEACGEHSTLTEEQFRNFDYENFTQSPLSTDLIMDAWHEIASKLGALCILSLSLSSKYHYNILMMDNVWRDLFLRELKLNMIKAPPVAHPWRIVYGANGVGTHIFSRDIAPFDHIEFVEELGGLLLGNEVIIGSHFLKPGASPKDRVHALIESISNTIYPAKSSMVIEIKAGVWIAELHERDRMEKSFAMRHIELFADSRYIADQGKYERLFLDSDVPVGYATCTGVFDKDRINDPLNLGAFGDWEEEILTQNGLAVKGDVPDVGTVGRNLVRYCYDLYSIGNEVAGIRGAIAG